MLRYLCLACCLTLLCSSISLAGLVPLADSGHVRAEETGFLNLETFSPDISTAFTTGVELISSSNLEIGTYGPEYDDRRVITEFDLSSISEPTVSSAFLRYDLASFAGHSGGIFGFSVSWYIGDGLLAVGDFDQTATDFFSVSYNPFEGDIVPDFFLIDVTSIVQQAINNGDSILAFRGQVSSGPPSETSSADFSSITLDVTAIPEPATAGLLALGALALMRRRRVG